MLTVRITDEFNSVFSFDSESDKEVIRIVSEWLKNRDETPIYEITIEVNDE